MNKETARQNLMEIANVLNYLGVKWWLEAGTCLGAIREGKIIDHDLDTDIGIWPGTNPYPIIEELVKCGFHIGHLFGKPAKEFGQKIGFEVAFIKNEVKTDLFFFYEDDKFWHAAWDNGRMLRLEFTKFGLKEIDFLGFKAFVPDPVERYLEERYGDWQTVKKDWRWDKDPLCLTRVLTYGTFDGMHLGHINLLKRARDLGAYLVVGVSSDEFNALKGKKSLLTFEERKRLVELSGYADEVIKEDNWNQKLDDIKNHNIHTLVMGDDWTGKFDDLPCKVVYLPRTEGISTTLLKERAK